MKKLKGSQDEITFTEQDCMEMAKDTSNLLVSQKMSQWGTATNANLHSYNLTDNVEFWKWMGRNYEGSGIFNDPQSIANYVNQSPGKEGWMNLQLQGKGYEWDWMSSERSGIKNAFSSFFAGDSPTQPGIDVTKTNLLTGKQTTYQHKAYISKANPNLSHTRPSEATVVTNAEKVANVQEKGFEVQGFKDVEQIKSSTNERLAQAKSGLAQTDYSLQNVGDTMAKAGTAGFVIGATVETMSQYKAWKAGAISDEAYLTEVLKAGGEAGVTGAVTSGLMIPVNVALTAAGVTSLVAFPVSIVLAATVNKVVAPAFGRGKYREYLNEAKYYQSVGLMYKDLVHTMSVSNRHFELFLTEVDKQRGTYESYQEADRALSEIDSQLNQSLKNLYDSI